MHMRWSQESAVIRDARVATNVALRVSFYTGSRISQPQLLLRDTRRVKGVRQGQNISSLYSDRVKVCLFQQLELETF